MKTEPGTTIIALLICSAFLILGLVFGWLARGLARPEPVKEPIQYGLTTLEYRPTLTHVEF
jgi:hypothetical protein